MPYGKSTELCAQKPKFKPELHHKQALLPYAVTKTVWASVSSFFK